MAQVSIVREVKMVLEEDTVECSRCETATPESEVIELGSWWLCGICYDDV